MIRTASVTLQTRATHMVVCAGGRVPALTDTSRELWCLRRRQSSGSGVVPRGPVVCVRVYARMLVRCGRRIFTQMHTIRPRIYSLASASGRALRRDGAGMQIDCRLYTISCVLVPRLNLLHIYIRTHVYSLVVGMSGCRISSDILDAVERREGGGGEGYSQDRLG